MARPVTGSHIAAAVWKLDQQGGTTKDALLRKAMAQLRAVPSSVVMAGDLRRHPKRLLESRIDWLFAHARRPPEGFQDSRVPHVADLVQYYANQYQEIVEHAAGILPEPDQPRTERSSNEPARFP